MSRHVGRSERWTQEDARRYSSAEGTVVFERGAWYALLRYHLRHEPSQWEAHEQRLGPFKRPRNAMLALEREATFLRNRHQGDVCIGELTSRER